MTITVLPGQTLIDIAIRRYGDAQGLIWLLQDNPNLEQANELVAGSSLVIREEVILKDVVLFFASKGIEPATSTNYQPPIKSLPYYENNYIINGYFE